MRLEHNIFDTKTNHNTIKNWKKKKKKKTKKNKKKIKKKKKKKKKKTRVKPRHFYHSHTKRKLTNDYDCSICMTMFLWV